MSSVTFSDCSDLLEQPLSVSTPSVSDSDEAQDILTYVPPATYKCPLLHNHALAGRRITVLWADEGWYDAIVVTYLHEFNKHRLVYTEDGAIEQVNLRTVDWRLAPKQCLSPCQPSLVGSTIEFNHPSFDRVFVAIVYRSDQSAEYIGIAYTNEPKTDILTGGGWKVVKDSPSMLYLT